MIIFPSFTTIIFSLKLAFALFMVCLLHFYVFITNSAQTLCWLSKALLRVFRCLLHFEMSSFSGELSQGLWPVLLFYSLLLVLSRHPGIFLHRQPRGSRCPTPVSRLPEPLTPFFLFYCLRLEKYFLQFLPKEMCPGG